MPNPNPTASLWMATTHWKPRPPLEGDRRTEALVIGGGLTGVLCAHYLQQAGVSCLLVEAGRLGGGASGHTTAKITLLHGLRYASLRQTCHEAAAQYLAAQRLALAEYRRLCAGIPCDYAEQSAYVYALDDAGAVHREAEALNALGQEVSFVSDLPLPFKVAGAVMCGGQARFHPLKLLYALAEPLAIHEGTPVTEVRGNVAVTPQGRICADKILFACHYPFVDSRGGFFAKQYQHRSYVLALENAPALDGMYVDAQENGLSFRAHGDLLLLGGGDHRTGWRGGGHGALRAFAASAYPGALERYAWAAQDCMTLDSLPYIGGYSRREPNWYVATGFGKWGMSNAMVAALLLRDLALKERPDWAEVFAPGRAPRFLPLLAQAGVSALGLLAPTTRRCTHMGCGLRYNPQENSYDCPCHGSRFSESGAVLDGPTARRTGKGR